MPNTENHDEQDGPNAVIAVTDDQKKLLLAVMGNSRFWDTVRTLGGNTSSDEADDEGRLRCAVCGSSELVIKGPLPGLEPEFVAYPERHGGDA